MMRWLYNGVWIAFVCPVLLCVTQAEASVYSYTDPSGVIHFTDTPPDKRFKPFFKSKIAEKKVNGEKNVLTPEEIDPYVQHFSRVHEISDDLIHAIIKAESNYDALAVSPAGAMGLMQLMPNTAKIYDVYDLYNPRENIRGGVSYLKYLLQTFGGDLRLMLAGYNAGPTAVIKAGYRVPNYPETKTYVKRVLKNYRSLMENRVGR